MDIQNAISALKADILKRRRQRIRHTTYDTVAGLIIQDTAPEAPFRNRMVIDWWHRVVDPLEAERFDEERLRYFRDRLKEHERSLAVNSAIRQGRAKGKTLRRLPPPKLALYKHQVRRLAPGSVNYAAVEQAVAGNDKAFEQLVYGLVMLPRLSTSRFGFMERVVTRVVADSRSDALFVKAAETGASAFPGMTARRIAERIGQIRNPFDPVWLQAYSEETLIDHLTKKQFMSAQHSRYSSYFK